MPRKNKTATKAKSEGDDRPELSVTCTITEQPADKLCLRESLASGEIDGTQFQLDRALSGMHIGVKFGERRFWLNLTDLVQAIYGQHVKGATGATKETENAD